MAVEGIYQEDNPQVVDKMRQEQGGMKREVDKRMMQEVGGMSVVVVVVDMECELNVYMKDMEMEGKL